MEEGTIISWLVEKGARVDPNMELVEVETSKINNVIECPIVGSMRQIVVAEGETAPVGALLGVVADPSVSDAEINRFVDQFDVGIPQNDVDAALAVDGHVERVVVRRPKVLGEDSVVPEV